jgi:integrase
VGRYPSNRRRFGTRARRIDAIGYLRFQSGLQPRPSGSTINARIAVADRALRNEFPDAPCQIARGFHQAYLRRRPMGLARPRWAISRLRVKESKRSIVPLSIDEVARFWSSFRTTRDLAIVGLMLLQGLRSAEVLALNPDDVLLFEGQVRVRGKGSKLRFLPLAPETVQLLDHYVRLERPNLRFRHTFASDMVRAGVSLPALMRLMGHSDIQTTLLYVQVTPQDVYVEYARAVAQHIRPLPGTLS